MFGIKKHNKIQIQSLLVALSVLLCLIKMGAYYITSSNAILSDALESIVNIITGAFGLYAIILATKPGDEDHPYGHGRIELISSGIEGTLIFIAGIGIGIQAIKGFINPQSLPLINKGLPIILITAVLNFIVGYYARNTGKKNNSLTLEAGGQHLLVDAYTTIFLFLGLMLISITKIYWIDNLLALGLSMFILINSIKILKKSVAGIMDEVDPERINIVVEILQKERHNSWIDIHNLRLIKYGDKLHVDCHITLPRYYSIDEAHEEVKNLEELLKNNINGLHELFIHTDPCIPQCCKNCNIEKCNIRTTAFSDSIIWTPTNIMYNKKHSL